MMKRIGVLGLVLAVSLLMSVVAPTLAKPNTPTHAHIVHKITIEEPTKGPPMPPPPGEKAPGMATGDLGTSLASGAQLWAIIIGISDYAGTVNDLRYSDDDALEVRATLLERYGYPAGHIKLLMGERETGRHSDISQLATRDNIKAAIDYIKNREVDGDEVVFYYSGHGAEGGGMQGIVPWEATLASVIWDTDLASWFSDFNTSRIVLGFDSCMAGGMSPELEAPGRILAMASTETGLSYELGGRIKNGEFTYWFVDDGMYDGRADYYDHDANPATADVTVEEAWDHANANCVYDTPTNADLFTDDFLMGYYGPPTLVSITVTPETATIPVGGTQQFTATGNYSDGSEADLTTIVTWTSLDPTVATIGSTGLATGLSIGEATIKATLDSLSDTATLTVIEAGAVSVTIEKVVARDIRLGARYNIQAKIKNTGVAVALIHVDATVSGEGGPQELVTQVVSIDPGTQANVLFKDRCTVPRGTYTVTVTVQEDATATGSDTFKVK